ncbi:MAG TPA: sulfotransferase, partial [Tahibacter sp.]|nr:sulfotransferase [Tahibacter sp.]
MSSTERDRLRGLPARAREMAAAAERSLARHDLAAASRALDATLAAHPTHPELLRLQGLLALFRGDIASAIARLGEAAAAWPDDALAAGNLGTALAANGDVDAALDWFQRATALDNASIDAWYNLGRALDLRGDAAGAKAAFDAVIALDPGHRAARILRAETLTTLGVTADAEADLRGVLGEDPESVPAWVALANLKAFRAGDADALARAYRASTLTPSQRIDLAFAHASALEAEARYADSFAMFVEANAAKRATLQWNALAVGALVDGILAAFADTGARDADVDRGRGIVFLVGMPRSGSTLAEQILAAHPDVVAGGETGWLAGILQAESNRRALRFPHWVRDASADDWARLGGEYLARAAAARRDAAVFTDKTLTNWQTLGAIRRMLPGARIVHCRRDAIETAWSCYKHHFASDQRWSYDVDELAAFFGDAERALRVWSARHPGWIRAHRHERLVDDPEGATRALLAACGLAFDPACLRFQDASREVRTASAAQVRAPLASRAVASRYGALLD